MENFLSLLPDKVKKGLKVVSSSDVGLTHLLHISTNGKIKEFVPSITKRTANNEDRSVPRVSVAPTLLGCMIGYAATSYDFLADPDGEYGDSSYRGGWYIYGIPFEKALKPSSGLLWDQRYTDEHWLVTYNENSRSYKPTVFGKCFYKELINVARTGKVPFRRMVLLVEVSQDVSIKFSAKITLTKGYWEIIGDEPTTNVESWKHDAEYIVKELTKAEYTGVKKLSADMLSAPSSIGDDIKRIREFGEKKDLPEETINDFIADEFKDLKKEKEKKTSTESLVSYRW